MARPRSLPFDLPVDAKAALENFASHPNPKVYRVRPPATEEAIAAREAKLPCPLPAELREALLVHDGIRETFVNSRDYLGGTSTLASLRSAFRKQWTEIAEELGDDAPLRFGKRYVVIGAINGTGHDFILLDTGRLLDGAHPVVRIDLEDGEEITGFRSLTHYLHWVFLETNDVDPDVLSKLFPEFYRPRTFKKMMRDAQKIVFRKHGVTGGEEEP